MCDFANGDIVECVDDLPSLPESQVMPVRGALYTITNLRPVDGGHSVRLKELTPTCYLGGFCACGECGWNADRFRRVYRPSGDLIAGIKARLWRVETV